MGDGSLFWETRHAFEAEAAYRKLVDVISSANPHGTHAAIARTVGVEPGTLYDWRIYRVTPRLNRFISWVQASGLRLLLTFGETKTSIEDVDTLVLTLQEARRTRSGPSRRRQFLADELGHHYMAVYNWETGRHFPCPVVALAWTRVLGGELTVESGEA